jgi:8-oxo-dGTP pyrophosphatase MutT (NUDIX family)
MVTVRDAATVMLVRDAPTLQVFMLRRNLNSEFVGGAYVFPGGAVDDDDRHAHLDDVCAGRSDAEASAGLGIPAGGLAFWVAAIRECFEEAGVLLARHRTTGEAVDFSDPAVHERFAAHRGAVDAGERRLIDIARDEDLVLDVAGIQYFSHWITPVGAPRRYDTRFFVTAAPPGQVPLHDDRETVASLWVEPAEALVRCRRGELELIFPTIKNLEAIGRFERSAGLLDAARAIDDVPTVEPRVVAEDGGGMRILLPGDPGYDDVVDPPDGSVRIPVTGASNA